MSGKDIKRERRNEHKMDEILDLIRSYTGHPHVLLTNRANTSILLAMKTAKDLMPGKESILIPDQGGWLTFKQTPKKIGLVNNEVKTDYGVIDLTDLERYLKLGNAAAFIYTNPAGYFAEQPIKDIYSLCKGNCQVILDASGSIGNPSQCDGKHADMIVASFGKWKPVNAGKGGFISFRKKESYDTALLHYEKPDLSDKDLSDILKHLREGPARINEMIRKAKKAKKDLQEMGVLHPDKEGVNAVIAFKNEEEKKKIISYCEKESLEYTECPKYIRVNENAISIEIKRM